MGRQRLAWAGALALMGAPAYAQTRIQPIAPGQPQLQPQLQTVTQSETATGRSQTTGPLSGVGKTLADDGIYFRGLLTNEAAGNPTGGARQGYTNVGQVYVGADLDLQKLIGWDGATFHVTVYRDYGNGLANTTTGTFFKQQDIYKNNFTKLHLGLVSLEQKLFDDRLDVTVGRLGTTAFYGHLVPNCYFQMGVTCGIPVVLNSEAGFGLLPSATWGANIQYFVAPKIYVETGAFEVNPEISKTNGLDWSTHDATGVTVPFEVGYVNPSFKQTAFPSALKGGYYASTAPRVNPNLNSKGESYGLYGGKQANANSLRQGAYIMGDRVIWRPDRNSNHSIDLFGGYIQPFEHDEIVDRQIYGGLLLRQPFPGRDLDTVGFSATYLHLSGPELAYLRDARHRAGGTGGNSPNEWAFELNYGIGLTPAIRLTPNIQWVINPDNSADPNISYVPKNMFVIGMKLTINLAGVAGLPPPETAAPE